MEFLMEYHLAGIVIGVATFLIIGIFHPLVTKGEYYFGVRIWWIFLLMGIAAVFLLAAGYFIGYKTAYGSVENMGAAQAADQQTFYAEIREREAGRFLVKGLAVNDLNYRGEFTFSATGETALLWRGTAIGLSDLDAGDIIAVTFDGYVLESDPAQLQEVIRIQLLDDEK